MGSTKLKQDLNNCLINFDRRVLLTELLDDYQMAYEEVTNIVEKFVEEQEKKDKLKFDKRYMVHGKQQGEQKKEIFKIVEESKLKEWLNKLENAQSSLYSVEVAGGSKAAAAVFKPISVLKNVKIKNRNSTTASISNGNAETSKPNKAVEMKEVKQETNNSKVRKESPVKSLKSTAKVEASVKKTSPKTETSPSDKKVADKKSAQKKGISNFFAPSTSTTKKSEDTKDSKAASGVVKPPTPKKMEDFFKKQAEKPKTTETRNKTAANTSVQLFNDEQEEEPEGISSDEEEKLEALKRDIITSDIEMEAEDEDEAKHSNSIKRRRILDSDDEDEDPPVKQEKLDIKEETKVEEAAAETYLDEDGFVITKKPKHSTTANKSPATKKTPPVTLKTSPKVSKKSTASKDTKAATNAAGKSKQARIMNFFSKK